MIGDIISMLFALIGMACVIFITYYASRWYAKRMGPIAGGRFIKVIDRLIVSKASSLLIVEIAGAQYLIGVSDQNVQMLMRLDQNISVASDQGGRSDGLKELIGTESFKGFADLLRKRKGVD